MTVWGIDLGSKYIHMVGLGGKKPNFITDTSPHKDRASQLKMLGLLVRDYVDISDHVFIEEPPYVNNRRVFLALAQTSGALLAHSRAFTTQVVPVDTWKQTVVGKGGVSKQVVANWLAEHHPDLFSLAGGDQNFVDAACIALYGQGQVAGEDR